MNKLFLIAIAIFTLQVNAQKPNCPTSKQQHKKAFFKDLSAEQIANLKTKKMTLALDLTEVQQDKIYNINLDLAKDKKNKMAKFEEKEKNQKPSSEEKYNRQIVNLDKRITLKREMESILDKGQFEKWEKIQIHRKNRHNKFKVQTR